MVNGQRSEVRGRRSELAIKESLVDLMYPNADDEEIRPPSRLHYIFRILLQSQ